MHLLTSVLTWYQSFTDILRELRGNKAFLCDGGSQGGLLQPATTDILHRVSCIEELKRRRIIENRGSRICRSNETIAVASIAFDHGSLYAKLMDEHGDVLFSYYSDADLREAGFWIRHVLAEFRKERIIPFVVSVALPNECFTLQSIDDFDKESSVPIQENFYRLDIYDAFGVPSEAEVSIPIWVLPHLYAGYVSTRIHELLMTYSLDPSSDNYLDVVSVFPDDSAAFHTRSVKSSRPYAFCHQGSIYCAGFDTDISRKEIISPPYSDENLTSYDAVSKMQDGLLYVWLIDLFHTRGIVLKDMAQACYTVYACN